MIQPPNDRRPTTDDWVYPHERPVTNDQRLSRRSPRLGGEKARPTTNPQRPTTGPHAGPARKLISTAVDEVVSAPTEMKSTPVSAYERTFSSVIPPAHSSGMRREWCEQI